METSPVLRCSLLRWKPILPDSKSLYSRCYSAGLELALQAMTGSVIFITILYMPFQNVLNSPKSFSSLTWVLVCSELEASVLVNSFCGPGHSLLERQRFLCLEPFTLRGQRVTAFSFVDLVHLCWSSSLVTFLFWFEGVNGGLLTSNLQLPLMNASRLTTISEVHLIWKRYQGYLPIYRFDLNVFYLS